MAAEYLGTLGEAQALGPNSVSLGRFEVLGEPGTFGTHTIRLRVMDALNGPKAAPVEFSISIVAGGGGV